MNRLFYGPGDWLSTRLNRRQRVAVAAWVMIVTVLLIPFTYIWKDTIWLLWLLSILALTFGAWSVVAAETPVEHEIIE